MGPPDCLTLPLYPYLRPSFLSAITQVPRAWILHPPRIQHRRRQGCGALPPVPPGIGHSLPPSLPPSLPASRLFLHVVGGLWWGFRAVAVYSSSIPENFYMPVHFERFRFLLSRVDPSGLKMHLPPYWGMTRLSRNQMGGEGKGQSHVGHDTNMRFTCSLPASNRRL